MTEHNRVFIDSSVLIAAAISPTGSARALLIAGITGSILLFFSSDVFDETERNLRRKYPAALPSLEAFRDTFADQTVQPDAPLLERALDVVAAKDAPILAGAMAAGAAYLATYDQRHILIAAEQIQALFGVIAATPAEILEAIK